MMGSLVFSYVFPKGHKEGGLDPISSVYGLTTDTIARILNFFSFSWRMRHRAYPRCISYFDG